MFATFDLTMLEKFLFYCFKIFGIATMKFEISTVKNEKTNKRRSFACSRIGIVYNSFLVILTSTFNIILIGYKIENMSSLPNTREVQKITDVVQFGCALFTCVFILVYFCARQKKTVAIANQICQIYDFFSINHYGMDEKNILMFTLRIVCINFIFWLTMIITSVKVSIANPNALFFYYPAVYSCHMIMQTLLMQYSIILNMIGYFFENVNKSLIILLKKPNQLFFDTQCLNIDKIRSERLSQIRESYLILGKISEDISTFYSPPIFFCLSVTFVMLLRAGLYLAVSIADDISILTTTAVFHCVSYIIYYFFLLVLLTKMVSKIVTESKRTGEIVSDVVYHVKNREIVEKLNRFSNYVLHKNIKFTVFNLFALDESLLLLFTGSMATYLVIMMEFQ